MGRRTVARWASQLLCAALALANWANMDGAEFGSGTLTAPLAALCLGGGLLFLACAVLAATVPAAAVVSSIVGAAMCLPLYAYLIAPRLMQRLSAAPASVAVPDSVVANGWAMAGVGSVVAMALALAGGGHAMRPQG